MCVCINTCFVSRKSARHGASAVCVCENGQEESRGKVRASTACSNNETRSRCGAANETLGLCKKKKKIIIIKSEL